MIGHKDPEPTAAAKRTSGRASSPAPHTSSFGGGNSTSREQPPPTNQGRRPRPTRAQGRPSPRSRSPAPSRCPVASGHRCRLRRCSATTQNPPAPPSCTRVASAKAYVAQQPRLHLREQRHHVRSHRLHRQIHGAVAAQPQAPGAAVVVAGVVVEQARAPARDDPQAGAAHVFFQAAAADPAGHAAVGLDQQLGPRAAVGRALDAGDDGQRRQRGPR